MHLNFHRAILKNIGDYHDGDGKRVRKVEYNGGQIQREVVFVCSAGKLVEEYLSETECKMPSEKCKICVGRDFHRRSN